MTKYRYELHFPNASEWFDSDLEWEEFVEQFELGSVINIKGEEVMMNLSGPWTYFKRIDRNVKF